MADLEPACVVDVATIQVFVPAHAAFVVAASLLLTDSCVSPTMLPNDEFSLNGLEYISEKLMQCRHSATWANRLQTLVYTYLYICI